MLVKKLWLGIFIFFAGNSLAQDRITAFTDSCLQRVHKINSGVVTYSMKTKNFFNERIRSTINILYFSHPDTFSDSMSFILRRENGSMCLYDLDQFYVFYPNNKKIRVSRPSWAAIKSEIFHELLPLVTRSENIFNNVNRSEGILKRTISDSMFLQDVFTKMDFKRQVYLNMGGDTALSDVSSSFIYDKTTLLPFEYDVKLNWKKDSQLTKVNFTSISMNNLSTSKIITMINDTLKQLQSDGFVLEAEAPHDTPPIQLLDSNSIAPDITLNLIAGSSVRLSTIRSKLTLIDFWYISCLPCQSQIPVLNRINAKYKDQGLKIIGIDPFDDIKSDRMRKNIDVNNITYEIAATDRDVAEKEFNISGYPTLYLIDDNNRIIFSHVGFGKDLERELCEIIDKVVQ